MELEQRLRSVLLPFFVAVVVLGITDIILDKPASWTSIHIAVELALVAVSLGAALVLAWGWHHSSRSVARLTLALEERQAERDAWRGKAKAALDGLSVALDDQFEAWSLTPAERETALLLLQGQSHKSIASTTGRSDKTVRQHATAVYRKSGLGGRAELAGFFLSGLSA